MGRSPWTSSSQGFDRRLVLLAMLAFLLALLGALRLVRVAVHPRPPLGAPAGRTVPLRGPARLDPRPSPHIEHATNVRPLPEVNPRRQPLARASRVVENSEQPLFVPVPVAPVPTERVEDDDELLQQLEPDPIEDHHQHER